jgi:hypothetical protein
LSRTNLIVAHQVPTTQAHRHRIAVQGRRVRPGSLRVHVQVRLPGVAAVADLTKHLTWLDELACTRHHAASLHVTQDDPRPSTFEDHVIPDHLRAIGLRGSHVRRAVHRNDDVPPAGRQHRIAIDHVRGGIRRKKTYDAKTGAIDAHEVHAMALAAIRCESLPFERAQMRVD